MLTALMGASGAGKTTLMDVLADRKTGQSALLLSSSCCGPSMFGSLLFCLCGTGHHCQQQWDHLLEHRCSVPLQWVHVLEH